MIPPDRMLSLRLENPFHRDMFQEHDDESWVLSLSDLMSLLLIFFLVWTTLKAAGLEKPPNTASGSGRPDQMSFAPRQDALDGLKDTLLEFSPVDAPNGSIVIILSEDISFDSGSAELSPRGRVILERIAQKLRTGTHYRLKVLGHTDSQPVSARGRWSSNFELSLHRAASVASQLISAGIPPGRISCQGFGDLYPARKDRLPGKRRFNRRVELVIEPA